MAKHIPFLILFSGISSSFLSNSEEKKLGPVPSWEKDAEMKWKQAAGKKISV